MDHKNPTPPEPERLGLTADELLRIAESANMPWSVDEGTLLNFALAIAEYCAEIGDQFTVDGRNCGEAIRSHFGLG
ncbi:hypothetical protein [Bordetella petrii]|uniref:hypothetical protein n=1 Tax=Bordetella petrii TaxID=94624 RepID=UPI0012DC40CF|nr:hypothetical protein [Bordetella petrii]